jgi:hypothetical protein
MAGSRTGRGLVTVALCLAVAVIVAACSPAAPSGSGGASSPEPAADLECVIQQDPGPADAPEPGGEMDTSDEGAGRWRLCLDTPTTLSIEGTAWCRWDAARSNVEAVSGLPTAAGGIEYDAYIDFPSSGFEVHLTDRGSGTIANYGPREDLPDIETDAAHRTGLAPVDVALLTGGDVAPVGAAATLAGRLRWACGEPPAAA